MQPTYEQQTILDLYRTGEDLVIEAAAGSGKTSTLQLLATRHPQRRGYYLAFNRKVAQEAEQKFSGTGIMPRTFHSLALSMVDQRMRERFNRSSKRIPQQGYISALGIDSDYRFTDIVRRRDTVFSRAQIAWSARKTVNSFLKSVDEEPLPKHVPIPEGMPDRGIQTRLFQEMILGFARELWKDFSHPGGKLPIGFDALLKIFQLSRPKLPVDVVMFDEAQDANRLMLSILKNQDCQRLMVGDPGQAIYGWNGAIDSLNAFPEAHRAQLTLCWRFGKRIASEAQAWLDLLNIDLQIRGNPNRDSVVEQRLKRRPDAIITRTNAGSLAEVTRLLDENVRVGLAGESFKKSLQQLALAALELKERGFTRHEDLQGFRSWGEVVEFSETEEGQNYSRLVEAVDEHGAHSLLQCLNQCRTHDAEVVVSTAHVAKGLEWDTVKVSDDFIEPKEDKETNTFTFATEEARIGYVTVTRAQYHLSPSQLAWVRKPPEGLTLI